MALQASQMVVASWYLILYCKVNNVFFFPKCIIEPMSLIIHKWWKPHGKAKLIGYVKREKNSDLCKIWDESPTDGGWHL